MDQIDTKNRDADPATANLSGDGAGGVRSVQRAFSLLQCLTAERPATTLTEFAQGTGLAISTVQRLLTTLEANAVLRRLLGGEYTFGSTLQQIAVIALGSQQLHQIVERHLDRLSVETGETANFAVLDEAGQVFYLRQTLSNRTLRHAGWLGRAFPAKGTAIGGALTGQVDEEGLVSTRDTLEPDVTAVAAPIYGPAETGASTIVGAISVTGPSFRIDDSALASCRDLVAKEARELTASIGGQWPAPSAQPSERDT